MRRADWTCPDPLDPAVCQRCSGEQSLRTSIWLATCPLEFRHPGGRSCPAATPWMAHPIAVQGTMLQTYWALGSYSCPLPTPESTDKPGCLGTHIDRSRCSRQGRHAPGTLGLQTFPRQRAHARLQCNTHATPIYHLYKPR